MSEGIAKRPSRNGVALSVVITLLGGAITGASTWGAVSQRVESLEDKTRQIAEDARQQAAENKQLRDLLVEANTKLAVVSAQNSDIIRRIDRMETKMDRDR